MPATKKQLRFLRSRKVRDAVSKASKAWMARSIWMSHPDISRSVRMQPEHVEEWAARGWSRGRKAINGNHLRRKRPFEWLYNMLAVRAAHYGKPLDLIYEDFIYLRGLCICHYCGDKFNERMAGLDRKDCNKGYSVANCVPCCHRCNIAKGYFFSYDEWVEVGKLLLRMREEGRLRVVRLLD
jgi:5-methylcytosine-specific restriction endonuclease McrA